MTLGRREYTEADMLRMQRDAEERVREMQNRARETVEKDSLNIPPRNRNWSSGQGSRRQTRRSQPDASPRRGQNERPPPPEAPPEAPKEAPAPPETQEEAKKTTIIEDVMGALNLDEDYLLIIGLLLILINQRADTTLILALAYLLI